MKLHLLTALLAILSISTQTFSQAGTLDRNFGNKGIAQIPVMLSNGETGVKPTQIAQLSNGKFIVGIIASAYAYFDAYIYRLNNNGSVDSVFGNYGRKLVYSGTNNFEFHDLLIDSNDNILFSEIIYSSGLGFNKTKVIRLKKDGSYDSSFNGNGIKIINKNVPFLFGFAIGLRPSGKILVSSSYRSSKNHEAPRDTTIQYQFRYNGTLDSSFNGVGYLISKNNEFRNIGVQPDGRIIYAGDYLEQLNSNGTRNLNFADTGIIKPKGTTYNLEIMPDGKFMCLTLSYEDVTCLCAGAATIRLYKFNKNGKLDSSLKASGIFPIYNRIEYYTGAPFVGNIIVQPDGKFLLNTVDADGLHPKITRYLSNGNIDSTFAHKGAVNTVYVTNRIFFQKNLKIVALQNGPSRNDTGYFDILRYNNDIGNTNTFFPASSQIKATDKNNSSIKISPNPVSGVLNVSGILSNTNLTIVNLNGEKLANTIATSDTYKWNIQNLSAGTYFIVASQNDKVIASIKFIKQ